jgi:hypothetical protein
VEIDAVVVVVVAVVAVVARTLQFLNETETSCQQMPQAFRLLKTNLMQS